MQISMDGRGRVFDNIFVERLWRSVKYERLYLCPTRAAIRKWGTPLRDGQAWCDVVLRMGSHHIALHS